MDKQFDTAQELNLNEEILAGLVDNETLLVGGGTWFTNFG